MKTLSRYRPGVTLLETILVIILLAAASVAGLILFDGQWIDRRGATLTTTDVANALKTARNTSITTQANVHVMRNVDKGHQQLLIVEDPGPYRDGSKWQIDLGTETRITGNPVEIEFRPDGTSDRKLDWKVSQASLAGEITVLPITGRISRILP